MCFYRMVFLAVFGWWRPCNHSFSLHSTLVSLTIEFKNAPLSNHSAWRLGASPGSSTVTVMLPKPLFAWALRFTLNAVWALCMVECLQARRWISQARWPPASQSSSCLALKWHLHSAASCFVLLARTKPPEQQLPLRSSSTRQQCWALACQVLAARVLRRSPVQIQLRWGTVLRVTRQLTFGHGLLA
jgi:hypothetical protein